MLHNSEDIISSCASSDPASSSIIYSVEDTVKSGSAAEMDGHASFTMAIDGILYNEPVEEAEEENGDEEVTKASNEYPSSNAGLSEASSYENESSDDAELCPLLTT